MNNTLRNEQKLMTWTTIVNTDRSTLNSDYRTVNNHYNPVNTSCTTNQHCTLITSQCTVKNDCTTHNEEWEEIILSLKLRSYPRRRGVEGSRSPLEWVTRVHCGWPGSDGRCNIRSRFEDYPRENSVIRRMKERKLEKKMYSVLRGWGKNMKDAKEKIRKSINSVLRGKGKKCRY